MIGGFNPLSLVGSIVQGENPLEQIMDAVTPDQQPRHSGQPDHIMQFFAYSHLPTNLQRVSAPFGQLAEALVAHLPSNPERDIALRKLLEAKDAAVRASLAK